MAARSFRLLTSMKILDGTPPRDSHKTQSRKNAAFCGSPKPSDAKNASWETATARPAPHALAAATDASTPFTLPNASGTAPEPAARTVPGNARDGTEIDFTSFARRVRSASGPPASSTSTPANAAAVKSPATSAASATIFFIPRSPGNAFVNFSFTTSSNYTVAMA